MRHHEIPHISAYHSRPCSLFSYLVLWRVPPNCSEAPGHTSVPLHMLFPLLAVLSLLASFNSLIKPYHSPGFLGHPFLVHSPQHLLLSSFCHLYPDWSELLLEVGLCLIPASLGPGWRPSRQDVVQTLNKD
jgi:hypothetical protein